VITEMEEVKLYASVCVVVITGAERVAAVLRQVAADAARQWRVDVFSSVFNALQQTFRARCSR